MNKRQTELELLEFPLQVSSLDIVQYQYFHNLFSRRTIVFNTAVDTDIVESLIMPLLEFEKDESEEPVTLILSSPGGSTFAGLSVCNIIDNYKKKLNILVPNYAMSMGFYILCAGAHNPNVTRYAYPFSMFLSHAGEVGVQAEAGSARDTMAFFDRIDDSIREFVLSHTKISAEQYDEHLRKQWYMTAAEMKEFGIVDYIIGVDVDGI